MGFAALHSVLVKCTRLTLSTKQMPKPVCLEPLRLRALNSIAILLEISLAVWRTFLDLIN